MRASASRLRAALGALKGEQRLAAGAAAALLGTMFLPWFGKSVASAPGSKEFAHDTISAFGAVSFVEASIFLVSAGVLLLVLTRAEGGRYHLPGGDGTVILVAGLWAGALIFYRAFDLPDVTGPGATIGIQWGFIAAFVAAGALAFTGRRMRLAERPTTPRIREPRPGRRSVPSPPDWSEDLTDVVRAPRMRTDVMPAGEGRTEAATEIVPAVEDADTSATPRAPRPPGSRPPRDRAVRREDAEQLELDDPPDAPPLSGDARRTRDRG